MHLILFNAGSSERRLLKKISYSILWHTPSTDRDATERVYAINLMSQRALQNDSNTPTSKQI